MFYFLFFLINFFQRHRRTQRGYVREGGREGERETEGERREEELRRTEERAE